MEVVDNIALMSGASHKDISVGANVTGIIENNICETSSTGSLPVDCPPDKLPDFDVDHF